MTRMGMVIRLRPECAAEYKQLHAEVWPSVLAQIAACRIRNYTIFLREPENLLFATLDYYGTDFAADMRRMAADPETQRWWSLTDPCQEPFETRAEGEWWAAMKEVFHVD
jgi:L-rhamnose mutarotase